VCTRERATEYALEQAAALLRTDPSVLIVIKHADHSVDEVLRVCRTDTHL
jgi:hypothetical protein